MSSVTNYPFRTPSMYTSVVTDTGGLVRVHTQHWKNVLCYIFANSLPPTTKI